MTSLAFVTGSFHKKTNRLEARSIVPLFAQGRSHRGWEEIEENQPQKQGKSGKMGR